MLCMQRVLLCLFRKKKSLFPVSVKNKSLFPVSVGQKPLFPVQVRAAALRWAPWMARLDNVLACNVYYCLFCKERSCYSLCRCEQQQSVGRLGRHVSTLCLHATCIIVCFEKKAVIPCAGASNSKALGALDGTFQHCACMQRVLLSVLKRKKLLFPVQVRAAAKRWAPWTARFNTVLACNVYYCLF